MASLRLPAEGHWLWYYTYLDGVLVERKHGVAQAGTVGKRGTLRRSSDFEYVCVHMGVRSCGYVLVSAGECNGQRCEHPGAGCEWPKVGAEN